MKQFLREVWEVITFIATSIFVVLGVTSAVIRVLVTGKLAPSHTIQFGMVFAWFAICVIIVAVLTIIF